VGSPARDRAASPRSQVASGASRGAHAADPHTHTRFACGRCLLASITKPAARRSRAAARPSAADRPTRRPAAGSACRCAG